jgi:hypothetical protein
LGGPLDIVGGGWHVNKKNSCKEWNLKNKFMQAFRERKHGMFRKF